MKNNLITRPKVNDLPDRTVALLALAGQQSHRKTTCPTDKELMAFMQGKLKSKAHDEMLTHLIQCPDCYQHWLEESRALFATKGRMFEIPIFNKLFQWWHQFRWDNVLGLHVGWDDVLGLHKTWQMPIYFAIIAVFVVLIQFLPKFSINTPPPIADNNALSIDSIMEDYNLLSGMEPLSTPKVAPNPSVLGFAESGLRDEAVAYRRYLDNGVQALRGDVMLLTDFEIQYLKQCQLAQWVALSMAALERTDKLDVTFWQRQLQRSQQFAQQFADSPAIVKDLNRISRIYKAITDDLSHLNSAQIIKTLRKKFDNLNEKY